MSQREKEVFNLGAPKVIQTIREDYSNYVEELKYNFIKNVFNPKKSYKYFDMTKSLGKIDNKVGIEFLEATDIPDMPGHAMMTMNISTASTPSRWTCKLNHLNFCRSAGRRSKSTKAWET
jgi:hypothetical protein